MNIVKNNDQINQAKRIPYLDGIRGISIILVLFGHGTYSLPYAEKFASYYSMAFNSHVGVLIFFVLSGYLITNILLNEFEKKGTISLKNFYLRRAIRIFPVFYFYILVVVVLAFFHIIHVEKGSVIIAAFYLSNYKSLFDLPFEWYLEHFWTLSLEEQFYLIWPSILLLLGIRNGKKFLYIIVCLYPISRIITHYLLPQTWWQILGMLHTAGDAIFWGCIAAFIERYEKEKLDNIIQAIKSKYAYIPFAALFFLFILSPQISFYLTKYNYSLIIGFTIDICIITFVLLYIMHSNLPVFNILNNKYLMHVGVLSYSLYVWQQLFLTPLNTSLTSILPYNLICCFICAYISFYLIEKPILRLRKKIKD